MSNAFESKTPKIVMEHTTIWKKSQTEKLKKVDLFWVPLFLFSEDNFLFSEFRKWKKNLLVKMN